MVNVFDSLSTGFKKYAANTSWMLAERVLRMGITLIVGIYVVRYLGPLKFGLLSYMISFVGLFAPLTLIGMNEVVVRDLLLIPGRQDTIMGTAFAMMVAGAATAIVLIALSAYLTEPDAHTVNMILIISIGVLFQSFNVIDCYLQAQVKSRYSVFAQTIQLLLSSGLKVFGIWNKCGIAFFAWVTCSDALVLATGLIFYYKKNGQSIMQWRPDISTARTLITQSWPLILSSLVISAYMRIDQIMIREMIDAGAVGQYAAAVKLSEAWYFIPMVISASLFPAIVSAKKTSHAHYQRRLRQLYSLMIWLGVILALPCTFLSHWIVNFLYGSAFHQSATVLMIHMWASVFVFLGVASSKWLLLEGFFFLSFMRSLLGLLINIGCNIVLIPIYGIVGAAMATLISYFFAVASTGFLSSDAKVKENFRLMAVAAYRIRAL